MEIDQKISLVRSKGVWITAIASILIFALIAYLVDLEALHAKAGEIPALLVILVLCILPVLGVPVTFLYVIAGAKFGAWEGVFWAVVSIAFNLVATYGIARGFVQDWLEKLLLRTKYRLPRAPEGEYVSICLWTALVPGIPYALKNYLLVLGKVPFRPYFFACLPAHGVHASIGILFGHITGDLTIAKGIYLSIYILVLGWLTRRLMKRLKPAGDEKGGTAPHSQTV